MGGRFALMAEVFDGAAEIRKVLDLFKIDYAQDQTFDGLRYGPLDALLPVEFSFSVQGRELFVLFLTDEFASDQLEKLLSFSEGHGNSLLVIDSRDGGRIQEVVSRFIDDARAGKVEVAEDYADYSRGYFFASVDASQKPASAPVKKIDSDDRQKLLLENLELKRQVRGYEAALADFSAQVSELSDLVLANSQKIVALQSGDFSAKFDGEFRLHGSKYGHLTDSAKRLVFVVTKNLNCNWTEIQRYFKDNYDESVSISSIKRIYRQNTDEK